MNIGLEEEWKKYNKFNEKFIKLAFSDKLQYREKNFVMIVYEFLDMLSRITNLL